MTKVIDVNQFLDLSVEEIFADRFSRYSKYIIQDRALPDIRDGLKPVQRRIIYSMFKEGNVFDKQFRKSAKTVGNVIGNYHPHGDTSVYEAMVRMSQDWKNNERIIIIHGNNGSIDGDSPAAMRYTEAKLSQYAELMITNLNEDTVDMALNFDDTEYEPIVFPTKVPNLLINGATGISSGYATDIPPHNACEVIDACIYLNKHENASIEKIMEFIPGPDFPTGGTIEGIDEIKKAYTTGKGKIVIRSKYEIKKNVITITEIPYDVNKANLLQKIDLLRFEKKVDGIEEILDNSDQNGLEITIKLKTNANANAILNYLFKYTELQKNYNFNMVAINKNKPEQLGIIPILKAFLQHRENVIIRRSQFQLDKAKKRLHILEGLILAVSNLDEVIRIIRSSENKKTSKENLVLAFNITEEQAEAIVMMQLYRLSNTDIRELENNHRDIVETINYLTNLLASQEEIKKVINDELVEVKKLLKKPRRSVIANEKADLSFNQEDLVKEEECIVNINKLGYIKRSSVRSYLSSNGITNNNDTTLKVIKTNTKEKLLIILNDGTYVIIPIHLLDDDKYKDQGHHLGTIAKIADGTTIVNAFTFKDFKDIDHIYGLTKLGYLTKYKFTDLETTKYKQKIQMQKLKKDDELIAVDVNYNALDLLMYNKLILKTNLDRYLCLNFNNIETLNLKTVGKKAIKLRTNEVWENLFVVDKEILFISNACEYLKLSPMTLTETDKPSSLFTPLTTRKQALTHAIKLNTSNVLITTNHNQELLDTKKLSMAMPESKLKTLFKDTELINIEDSYI